MVFPADEPEVIEYGYMIDRGVEKEGSEYYHYFYIVMDEDSDDVFKVPVSKELFDWYGLYGGVKVVVMESRFGFQYGMKVVQ